MTSETLKPQDVVTISDVRLLAAANSSCVTTAPDIPTPLDLPVKLKSAVREVEKKLQDSPLEPHAAVSARGGISQSVLRRGRNHAFHCAAEQAGVGAHSTTGPRAPKPIGRWTGCRVDRGLASGPIPITNTKA